jgi:hypothetical protein
MEKLALQYNLVTNLTSMIVTQDVDFYENEGQNAATTSDPSRYNIFVPSLFQISRLEITMIMLECKKRIFVLLLPRLETFLDFCCSYGETRSHLDEYDDDLWEVTSRDDGKTSYSWSMFILPDSNSFFIQKKKMRSGFILRPFFEALL